MRLKQSGATSMPRARMGRARRAPHARGGRGHRRALQARRAAARRALAARPQPQAPRLRCGVCAAEQLEIRASFRSSPASRSASATSAKCAMGCSTSFQSERFNAGHYARPAGGPDTPLGTAPVERPEEEIRETCRRFGIEGEYTVLCPGAEYGPAKRWPYFSDLAARLGTPAVLLGSRNDEQAAAGIREEPHREDQPGRSDPAHRRAAAVVSNDSGSCTSQRRSGGRRWRCSARPAPNIPRPPRPGRACCGSSWNAAHASNENARSAIFVV